VAVTPQFSLLTVDGIAVDVHGNVHAVLIGFAVLGTPPLVQVNTATGVITPTITDPAEAAKFDTRSANDATARACMSRMPTCRKFREGPAQAWFASAWGFTAHPAEGRIIRISP
jgi:hypothetical protein